MNRARLEHAITIMRRVEELNKPFDMYNWFDTVHSAEVLNCNTAACFGGWCCRDTEFQQQGLKVYYNSVIEPEFGIRTGTGAFKEFFELSSTATDYLVLPEYYATVFVTPQEVIEHIEYLLYHDGEAPLYEEWNQKDHRWEPVL